MIRRKLHAHKYLVHITTQETIPLLAGCYRPLPYCASVCCRR